MDRIAPLRHVIVASVVLVGWVPSVATADSILFSRHISGTDQTASGIITSELHPITDDFTLAQNSVVTGFRWWGAYTGVRDETDAPPADFFFVCSFADQAHLLVYDNVCYNVAFPVSRTSTGLHTQFGSLIFEYFGTITIPMVAGTHYLELVNLEERIGPAWGWSNAPSVGSPDGLWRWNGTNWDEFVAFGGLGLEVIGREVDAAVPEPASLALVTAGIGGIAARRYRRRRARPHA